MYSVTKGDMKITLQGLRDWCSFERAILQGSWNDAPIIPEKQAVQGKGSRLYARKACQ
jgi:hypothetical protein